MTRFYLLLFLLPLASCSIYIDYMGNSYAPTQKVDFYVDRSAIKKPYTIMGKANAYSDFGHDIYGEKVQEALIKKAAEKGADAVLYEEYFLPRDGYSVETTSQTDSVGKGTRTIHTTTATPVSNTRREIFFLKYD